MDVCHDTTIVVLEHRLSRAWYVKFDSDPYALGPYRFNNYEPATAAIELALNGAGRYPDEVWPEGHTLETDPYEIQLASPEYAWIDDLLVVHDEFRHNVADVDGFVWSVVPDEQLNEDD